jgi:hypothetical protein
LRFMTDVITFKTRELRELLELRELWGLEFCCVCSNTCWCHSLRRWRFAKTCQDFLGGWVCRVCRALTSQASISSYLQTGDRDWGFLHVGRALTKKDFSVGILLGCLSIVMWVPLFRVSKSQELLVAHSKTQIGSQAEECKATKLMNQTQTCQEWTNN